MWDKTNRAHAVVNDEQGSDGHNAMAHGQAPDGDAWAKSWQRVSSRLRVELGEDVYTSWFARVAVEEVHGGVVALSVPTRFLKNWINSHYMDRLLALWQIEDRRIVSIDLSVRGPEQGQAARNRVIEATRASNLAPGADHAANCNQPAAVMQMLPGSVTAGAGLGSQLDARYTFDTFSVGPANGLAHAAAQRMAAAQPLEGAAFNVLYVHSAVGLGKTHLLQATTAEARLHRRPDNVMYLTAERFMYRFVAALKAHDTLTFKDQLRGIELLLIDDMQFLQGKSIQQEFCHTLNELIESGRQVVVAADRAPSELDSLDERMRSRLSAGLVVDIQPLGRTLRLDILQRKLAAARQRFPGLQVGQDVLEFIADQVPGNGRELEGAFTRIVAHNQLNQAAVTLTMAEHAIRDLIRNVEPRRVRIEQIQRVVGKHFNVSRQDIVSSRRNRSIVRPRQICMYLAKTMTDRSFPEIGRRFGGRDHTTVLHAVRKIEGMMQGDQTFADEVELLRRLVEE